MTLLQWLALGAVAVPAALGLQWLLSPPAAAAAPATDDATTAQVTVSRNTLIDRLRKLQSDLSDENRHTDALLIDLAIQAIR